MLWSKLEDYFGWNEVENYYENEIQSLQKVQNLKNLVQYVDHSYDEDGNLLILMKRIKGKMLIYYLKEYEIAFKAIKDKNSDSFLK